jgi:hypothetical protein
MSRFREAMSIVRAVRLGRFVLRLHAHERMASRNLSVRQIIHIAETLTEWRWQERHQTYLFLGMIEPGKAGGFSAVISDEVWVVTVFRRRMKER